MSDRPDIHDETVRRAAEAIAAGLEGYQHAIDYEGYDGRTPPEVWAMGTLMCEFDVVDRADLARLRAERDALRAFAESVVAANPHDPALAWIKAQHDARAALSSGGEQDG